MRDNKYQWLKDIATVLVFFVCFVICFIWVQRKNDSEPIANNKTPTTQESIDQYKRNRYGDPVTTTCSYCGGAGKVGFAGESEASVKRNGGSGLGNICNVCKGSGKVKTYPNEPK